MWELDHKEDWAWKNWCFPIVVLEKTLESPLDCKGIKPVNSKGNQPWIFTGRTDAEALPDADVYLMLILATWCKQPTHWKKTLNLEVDVNNGRWPSPPPLPLHTYTMLYCWFIPTYLVACSVGEMMKGKMDFKSTAKQDGHHRTASYWTLGLY